MADVGKTKHRLDSGWVVRKAAVSQDIEVFCVCFVLVLESLLKGQSALGKSLSSSGG